MYFSFCQSTRLIKTPPRRGGVLELFYLPILNISPFSKALLANFIRS